MVFHAVAGAFDDDGFVEVDCNALQTSPGNETHLHGFRVDDGAGGPNRALYLHTVSGQDTSIRIHGTTEPGSIGRAVSNGCIRMRNEAVMDLFDKVPLGTPVYVY